jgi:hypothetical protein
MEPSLRESVYRFVFWTARGRQDLSVLCLDDLAAIDAAEIFAEECEQLELWRGDRMIWRANADGGYSNDLAGASVSRHDVH